MANNAQKISLARSLNKLGQDRARDAFHLTGKALPCSIVSIQGSLVKVKFEVISKPWTLPEITVPTFGLEYIRYPIQVGDKGGVLPFDVLMGAISGMGGNTADLRLPPANLGGLVFIGVSNKNWTAVNDANKLTMYGPNGFELRDTANNCSMVGDQNNITITAKTTLTLQVGSVSIVINSSGVSIQGKQFLTHHHSGVTTGSGNTGNVV